MVGRVAQRQVRESARFSRLRDPEGANAVTTQGCSDCPFAAFETECVALGERPFTPQSDEDVVLKFFPYGETGAPTWCPLRAGPITVTLAHGS